MIAFPFRIGADPEFVLLKDGKAINARSYILLLLKTEHPVQLGFKLAKAGIFGWDMLDNMEIRPEPSNFPSQVVENIEVLLQRITLLDKTLDIKSKYKETMLGGHIHLDFISDIKIPDDQIGELHQQMLKAHDLISGGEIQLVERTNKYKKHLRIHYRKKYGALTYEFMLPTAEWFTTPKLTKSMLVYYATIFHHLVHDQVSPKSEDIKKHAYYEHYKEEIDYVLNTAQVLKDKEEIDYSLIKGWKL